jgi:uncharacterized protein (TIGR02246 family)
MAGELEAVAQEMVAALDRNDPDGMLALAAEDVQGIDEISHRWLRGSGEVGNYVRQLASMVSDVRSTLDDVHETVVGDVGVLTAWLEQDYTLDGQQQHISAPTTLVFHRAGGDWKILLFHSVPLPDPADDQSG